MYYVGIDLGGTNIAVGICDENYNIVGRAETKTKAPRPCREICEDMVKATEMALADAKITMEDIAWIGIGSPGAIDPETGIVEYANNLGFKHEPMGAIMKELTGKDIYIENDANAASYGEAVAGAAKGSKNSVTITLGTGVGGGVIIDGKVFSGWNHFGTELGHTVIVHNGRRCSCGRKGCWEAYASVSALIYQSKRAMIEEPASKMWELVNGDINKVTGRTAFDALRAGDKAGKAVVDEYVSYIAEGIVDMVNIFQPEVLCVGGGISKEGELLLAPIREAVNANSYGRNTEKKTTICAAKLGNDAGIIGAAFLGRSLQN